MKSTGKTRIFLKQIILETQEGFLLKSAKEMRGLITSEGVFSKSPRISEDQPLGIYTFELSDKTLFVWRSYPTFLDLIGDIGGIVEVLLFISYCFMIIYSRVVFEQ